MLLCSYPGEDKIAAKVPARKIETIKNTIKACAEHALKILSEVLGMPRPKGSKNKKTVSISIQENVEDKIAAVEAEIAELGTQLKAKKADLKQLVKAKAESDRIAAERKAEEDKKAILDAVAKSGKSLEEILEMLGK